MSEPKTTTQGDWVTAIFAGDINTTQGAIMNYLSTTIPNSAGAAKIFQGTDQQGKAVCAVIYKP